MIIYFYLFIPLVFRLAESSSIKGRNDKNELVPFLSSRPEPQMKDNSLKIVSNEPFVIQFQMPPQESGKVAREVTTRNKKTKRQNKKRIYKSKPLRKKIRKRRDTSEIKNEEKKQQPKKPQTEEKGNQNKTQNSIGRLEILKALHSHAMKTELKKLHPQGLRKTPPSSRNLHRIHPTPLPDLHDRMTYPNTPKTEPQNYSYKDLMADRERLEKKINYIKNLLHVNDTKTEDGGRVRRRSESDRNAHKLAKMFLTLSAANKLRDKRKPKCSRDEERAQDVWEKERRKSATRQSSSSNEQRYKVKKWIEHMKNKRSGKTCTCVENEYNENGDVFPLEQKLSKDYQLSDTRSSEESSEDVSYGRLNKNDRNREDAMSKFRTLANGGRRKYELPLDDLEVYRTRAKQILQNAEEILDKIKEEEERRLSSPAALVSHLKELTSRVQGDPRNNENDLIKIIQKNLGWNPQSKSDSEADGNTFAENIKSFILDPYEKTKALTDEGTRKLSAYLLRNLGKIGSEEQAAGRNDESSQIYHGQPPQAEEMFSANLERENSEGSDRGREELQNWSDTLSEMLRSDVDEERTENAEGGAKQTADQEDMLRRRIDEIIQEQGKKISEWSENAETGGNNEGITSIDLMTGEEIETPKKTKPEDGKTLDPGKEDENKDKIDTNEGNMSRGDTAAKESESVKLRNGEIDADVRETKDEKTSEEEKAAGENADENEDEKVRVELPLELEEAKAVADENTPKVEETAADEMESPAEKDLESEADVSQKEGLVLSEAGESEKKASEESTNEAVERSQEGEKDETLQAKEDRDESDALNSKHLDVEGPERSSNDELEELAEDIQKLVDENSKEKSEETTRQDKADDIEESVMKKDSSERKDGEEEVSADSVALEKQRESVSEETQDALSDVQDSMSGVVKASQDEKESLEYDSQKKENEGESVVESEMSENTQSVVENEKSDESAEEVVEKKETSFETEKESAEDSKEKAKSVEEESEREDDTLKFASEDKEKDETVREEAEAEEDNQKKEISMKSLDEDDHGDEEETLKASLDDSENEQKSAETIEKSVEEREDNTDENVEERTLRSEKATEQSQEASEEVAMESAEASAKEANADETQDKEELKETETDSENEDDPQLRAEQIQKEDIEKEDGEAPLRSENSEDESNERQTATTKSEEKDETVEMEKSEENKDESSKATGDEDDETKEEAASPEDEKVEAERKNSEEGSKDEEGSLEVNREPKLLMTVKEGLGEEEFKEGNAEKEKEDGDALMEKTWRGSEEEDGDNRQSGGERREDSPEERSEEVQETNDKDDLSVRAENFQDLDNEIDSDDTMLRTANEDVTHTEVNSSEEKEGDEAEEVEGASVGRRKNVAESEESQNFGPNFSKSPLKVPKSIGKIMRDLDGKEKDDFSLTNLNPEEIDHFIGKIDEAELQNKLDSEDEDCRKECACADEIDTKSRNIGRYEIVKDFLHWAKDLRLNRVLTDN